MKAEKHLRPPRRRSRHKNNGRSNLIRIAAAVGISAASLFGLYETANQHKPANPDVMQEADTRVYYPELGNKEPQAKGNFTTSEGNTFHWFNFSKARFDPDAAQQIISFLESVAHNQLGGSIQLQTGKTVDFTAYPSQPHITEFYIVDDDTPNPAWGQQIVTGGTFKDYRPGLNLTTVRVTSNYLKGDTLLNTDVKYANFAATVEACQGAFNVVATDPQYTATAQEKECTSLSRALVSIGEGQNFQTYSTGAQGKASVLPTGQIIPDLLLDGTQYADLVSQLANIPSIISAQ